MGRFYNPFSPRRSTVAVAETIPGPIAEEPPPDDHTTATRSHHAPHPSVGTIPDRLDDIRDYVRGVSTYIHWFQSLTEHERSNVARVTEVKRELKLAHRNLEKLDADMYCELGDETEALVKDAMRHAWRSYRSVVKLEEKLRGSNGGSDSGVKLRRISGPQNERNTSTDHGKVEAYTRSDTMEVKQALYEALDVRQQPAEGNRDENPYLMSGALPVKDRSPQIEVQRAGRAHAFEALRQLPHLLAHGAPSQCSESLHLPATNPQKIPQPRDEVKVRVQEEEANTDSVLRNPYKVRRGSCNGFMITEMTMHAIEDTRFVLPYLHYMKVHELRAIKEWLGNAGFIVSSGSMRNQAEYIVLWGIWHKYTVSDGKAGEYFGFDWTCLAKVLVSLNVYMGRWRMQGKFAMDGPAFAWGKFFVPNDSRCVLDTRDGDQGGRNDAETSSFYAVARRGRLRESTDG
ncbi:unnamed protein product [Alternaria alternata]